MIGNRLQMRLDHPHCPAQVRWSRLRDETTHDPEKPAEDVDGLIPIIINKQYLSKYFRKPTVTRLWLSTQFHQSV